MKVRIVFGNGDVFETDAEDLATEVADYYIRNEYAVGDIDIYGDVITEDHIKMMIDKMRKDVSPSDIVEELICTTSWDGIKDRMKFVESRERKYDHCSAFDDDDFTTEFVHDDGRVEEI